MQNDTEFTVVVTEELIEHLSAVFNNYSILLHEFRILWYNRWFVSDRDEDECLDRLNDVETCRATLHKAIATVSESLDIDESVFKILQVTARDDIDEHLREKLYAREAERNAER